MTTLTVEQAEDVAARTLVTIDVVDGDGDPTLIDYLDADRERVASDLAGLREHVDRWWPPFGQACPIHGQPDCPDARRYADGLLRTAALYGVTP